MQLKAAEREVLFETPVFPRQLRKYVEAKRRISIAQARLDFADVGTRTFYTTMNRLIRSGDLLRDGNDLCVSLEAKTSSGSKADACWKAARLLGTFRVAKLAQIADVSPCYARSLCERWRQKGYLLVIGVEGRNIYKMLSSEGARPIISKQKTVAEEPEPREVADIRKRLLARIHIAKQRARVCTCGRLFFGTKCPDCGSKKSKMMPTWYYRQILSSICGKDSCSKMLKEELVKVMDFFNRAGFSKEHPYGGDPIKEVRKPLQGTIRQIRKRGREVLGPDWESRVDGFVRDVVRKPSLDKCCMYELRQVIGWINRTAKYRKSSN